MSNPVFSTSTRIAVPCYPAFGAVIWALVEGWTGFFIGLGCIIISATSIWALMAVYLSELKYIEYLEGRVDELAGKAYK